MAQVYAAVYSGVPVFEMNCRQVSVMRRRVDSYLNATQILKVAGVDKGRRTKILEREVQVGEHEKVQGGYGKYQGTWIPFQRGLEIARQYGVDELLRPLLEYVPGPDDPLETPRKRRMSVSRPSRASMETEMNNATAALGRKRSYSDVSVPGQIPAPQATDTFAFFQQMAVQQQQAQLQMQDQLNHGQDIQPPAQPQRPIPPNSERYRAILMSIFLNHENHKLPDLITNPNSPPDLDIDLIIDDQGHSSMHWASALARINVLQLLLNLGADPRRVNFNGESALIRAVLVTNNFDNDTFYDLLILLHSSIDICDKKGRSVIHHVALTAGIKGRVQASRYYLDNLLEMMQKNSMDIRAVIDLQDKNGDTALNIAARIGNRSLVEQLLKAGANPEIPNRAGLRPIDFGLEDVKLASLFSNKGDHGAGGPALDPTALPAFGLERPSSFNNHGFIDRGRELAGEFESTIASLDNNLRVKDNQLQDSLNQIRIVTKELAQARKVIHSLAQRVAAAELKASPSGPEIDGANPEATREQALSSEVYKLRTLLRAHGISSDETDSSGQNDSDSQAATTTDANTSSKVNQLLAQVLNVPSSDNMIDPLLNAVGSETMGLDDSQVTELLKQARMQQEHRQEQHLQEQQQPANGVAYSA